MSLMGLKSRRQWSWFLQKAREEYILCLFQFLEADNIHSGHITPISATVITWAFFLSVVKSSSTFLLKGYLQLYIGPAWIIQENLSISEFLIISAKFFLPHKVTFTGYRVQNLDIWASLFILPPMCLEKYHFLF